MSNRSTPPKDATVTSGAKTFAPILRHKPRGRAFGSGNPGQPFPPGHTGRPKGARNKATTTLAKMFRGEAAEIGRRAVELAKEGRVGAIKLILDRAYPARQGCLVEGFTLPPMTCAADAVAAMSSIVQGVTDGTLTVQEARDLSVLIENFRKLYELEDIDRRLTVLEKRKAQAAAWKFSGP